MIAIEATIEVATGEVVIEMEVEVLTAMSLQGTEEGMIGVRMKRIENRQLHGELKIFL